MNKQKHFVRAKQEAVSFTFQQEKAPDGTRKFNIEVMNSILSLNCYTLQD